LSTAQAAHHRRDAEHNRRDGQEHAVPRHAEVARDAGGDAVTVFITEVTSMKFQNETQGPSTPLCRAKGARHTSAHDKVMGVPGCLRYVDSRFEQTTRVMAES